MLLTLVEARRYADVAIAAAQAQGLRISVAVVDEGGILLQLDRMDGASIVSPDVALAKAVTALSFQEPTSAVAELAQSRPDLITSMQKNVQFGIVATDGGLPIVRDGTIVGAIGVSGAAGGHDEAVARAALG